MTGVETLEVVKTKDREARELRSSIMPKLEELAKSIGFNIEANLSDGRMWLSHVGSPKRRWKFFDFFRGGSISWVVLEPPTLDVYAHDWNRGYAQEFADEVERRLQRNLLDLGPIKHARVVLE